MPSSICRRNGLQPRRPADQLLLQDLDRPASAVLGRRRFQLDLVPSTRRSAPVSLKSKTGGDLTACLIDRICALLGISTLGVNRKARHARKLARLGRGPSPLRSEPARATIVSADGSDQVANGGQPVNLLAQLSKGFRILPAPPSPWQKERRRSALFSAASQRFFGPPAFTPGTGAGTRRWRRGRGAGSPRCPKPDAASPAPSPGGA